MAIFPKISLEKTVQVDDKTRLDASQSFITSEHGDISKVEIEPEATAEFFDVTQNKYLDWEYSTDGTKVVSARITTTEGTPTSSTSTKSLVIISVADDNLFSGDEDLTNIETDLLKRLPDGRSSFLNFHRKAQELILSWLDSAGFRKSDGTRFVKADILDIEEVRQWSTFLTLQLIFKNFSNAIDDIFIKKAEGFESDVVRERNRAILRIDIDGDGILQDREALSFRTVDLTRA